MAFSRTVERTDSTLVKNHTRRLLPLCPRVYAVGMQQEHRAPRTATETKEKVVTMTMTMTMIIMMDCRQGKGNYGVHSPISCDTSPKSVPCSSIAMPSRERLSASRDDANTIFCLIFASSGDLIKGDQQQVRSERAYRPRYTLMDESLRCKERAQNLAACLVCLWRHLEHEGLILTTKGR